MNLAPDPTSDDRYQAAPARRANAPAVRPTKTGAEPTRDRHVDGVQSTVARAAACPA